MKYLYFDTSFGFSPLMALGALVDLEKEDFLIKEILKPFSALLFCEQVQRGAFEGCLAHIDIGLAETESALGAVEMSDAPAKIKELAAKYADLAEEEIHLREILEAVCVCEVIENLGVDGVYFGCEKEETLLFEDDLFDSRVFPEAKEASFEISPFGNALLKLIGAVPGMPEGEIIHTGYGADVKSKNENGVLRAVVIESRQEGVFGTYSAYESLFMQETAIL